MEKEFYFSGDGMEMILAAEVSQSVEQNTSTLTITKVKVKQNGNYGGDVWLKGDIWIEGQLALSCRVESGGACYALLQNAWYEAVVTRWSGAAYTCSTVTVGHEPDGTKTVTISSSLNALRYQTSDVVASAKSSGTEFVLDTIPRASTSTAWAGELGQTLTVSISRQSAAMWEIITWACGTASGTVTAGTADAMVYWTPPLDLAWQAPQAAAVTITLIVVTMSGTTEVGRQNIAVSCGIPASIVPTVTMEVTDNRGLLGNVGAWLQGQSQARVTASGAGAYGSWIVSTVTSCGGLTAAGETTIFALQNAGTVPIAVTVTDSRGRKASITQNIYVSAYSPPLAQITETYRCHADGSRSDDGQYAAVVWNGAVTAVGSNTAGYALVMRDMDANTETETQIGGSGMQVTGQVTIVAVWDKNYQAVIRVWDKVTATESTPRVLGMVFRLLDFDKYGRSVGIGTRARLADTVCIGMDIDMGQRRISGLAEPVEQSDAATKGYIDGILRRLGLM